MHTYTYVYILILYIYTRCIKGGKLYNARLCENPLKEISVMQHIASQHRAHPGQHHIVQLRDVLRNDNYVFEVMKYYNGGDLFSRLLPTGMYIKICRTYV